MVFCNVTLTEQEIHETPLWKGFTFHHFGLMLSAIFGLAAVLTACFLIFQHAIHYSKPWQQKHIIRVLFMIPVYATVSFLSYLYYRHAIYFEVLRDCYEAFAIASFFALLCHYLEPTLHEQKNFFRQLSPRNWVLPIDWFQKCTGGEDRGIFRKPRSGLTWFNVIWIGVFQYCFIRVFFTIVSVVSQVAGRYCESSLNPAFAHIWVMVFEGASVTIAMYCLIQFYIQLKNDLSHHRPFLKVCCIKLVIFFSFWQSLVISFLSSSNGPLKPTDKINYPDIKVGIPSMLLCVEMFIFAILHLFAFSWREYDISRSAEPLTYQGGPAGAKALLDAFNLWDVVRASARGTRWLFVGRKHRHDDPSYRPTKLGTMDGASPQYTGVTYAGTGDAATEVVSDLARQGSCTPQPDEDRAGLLAHAQRNPANREPSPYRYDHRRGPGLQAQQSAGDLGVVQPGHLRDLPLPSAGSGTRLPYPDDADTSYRGVAQPVPYPQTSAGRQRPRPVDDMRR